MSWESYKQEGGRLRTSIWRRGSPEGRIQGGGERLFGSRLMYMRETVYKVYGRHDSF